MQGKVVNIGLGPYPIVTLSEAREQALENARIARRGGNPRQTEVKVPTFSEAAEEVLATLAKSWWAGGRVEQQWRSSLETYVFPRIGGKRIDRITTADVLAVLRPIWTTKRPTAEQVRRRMAAIMQWSVVQGHRSDDPVAPVDAVLPRNGARTTHQRALHHSKVADALAKVRTSNAYVGMKDAIEFLTLTAARSIEVRGASWGEIDLNARTWVVPASRMKTGIEHRVPLSQAAVDVLERAKEYSTSALVFPSATGRLMSDAVLSKLLRRCAPGGTIHGMRSSFRDWCAETGVSRELSEMALAHVVRGVEGAYLRTTMFEQRRALMKAWALYLNS